MFNLKFISRISVLGALLLLIGCGQTGPLYLPAKTSLTPNTAIVRSTK